MPLSLPVSEFDVHTWNRIDEIASVFLLRITEQILGGVFFHQLAVLQYNYVVCGLPNHCKIVSNKEVREIVLVLQIL